MIDVALIMMCAPTVHPNTIKALIQEESQGNRLAVNINHKNGITLRPKKKIKTAKDATQVAHAAIRLGHTVDLGYMQIHSPNLKRLGYTVEDMFDPCKNIAAGGKIYTEFYLKAKKIYKNDQAAIRAALSAYNTGSFIRGFENGYVAKYVPGVRR